MIELLANQVGLLKFGAALLVNFNKNMSKTIFSSHIGCVGYERKTEVLAVIWLFTVNSLLYFV